MSKLTFASFLGKIKKSKDLNQATDDMQLLVGAIVTQLPTAAAAAGAPVLPAAGLAAFFRWLSKEEKVIDFGQRMIKLFSSWRPKDYSGSIEKMQLAFAVTCLTAFFDELKALLPDTVKQQLALSDDEIRKIYNPDDQSSPSKGNKDVTIPAPDLSQDFLGNTTQLEALYTSMNERLMAFVHNLSFNDTASEIDVLAFDKACDVLPINAIKRFKSYYLELCANYNLFYIYSQISRERAAVAEFRIGQRETQKKVMDLEDSFYGLKEVIQNLPDAILEGQAKQEAEEAKKYAGNLRKTYENEINKLIIGSHDAYDDKADDALIYPTIRAAFIYQAYHMLRYTEKEKLDQPSTWKNMGDPQKDLPLFLERYFLDPASIENLFLILGEPGAGKSVLTKMMCGQPHNDNELFIRIPLRDHNHDVEGDIETIALAQLKKDCKPSKEIPTFKWFQEKFRDTPITLIFDGLDEVLQATGGIYPGLVKKIHEFQLSCLKDNLPVRIIITSRDTMIHKATIPAGTLVMHLEEFDQEQRDNWISIWNDSNRDKLAASGLAEFTLPPDNKDIERLASQPLLLTMLAIYDADFEKGRNALQSSDKLNRAQLYNELLRRFIRRELRKGSRGEEVAFDELDDEKKQARIHDEMLKLGIVALGMFSRERLYITKDEVKSDLDCLQISGNVPKHGINTTRFDNAFGLLGSFFFIHTTEYNSALRSNESGTYEFLHKTFYEFLLSDIVLQSLISATDDLYDVQNSPRRGRENYTAALEKPDGNAYSLIYYAALTSNFLCREPETIRLIAEWSTDKLNQYSLENPKGIEATAFLEVSKDIFGYHYEHVRKHGLITTPKLDSLNQFGIISEDFNEPAQQDFEKTLPQKSAIYLFNLLILLIQSRQEFSLTPDVWGWLSQYEETILQFTSMSDLESTSMGVVFHSKEIFTDWKQKTLLDAQSSISQFMLDSVSQKVDSLHDLQATLDNKIDSMSKLEEMGLPLELESMIAIMNKSIIFKTVEAFPMYDYENGGKLYSYRDILNRVGISILNKNADASLTLEYLRSLSEFLDQFSSLSVNGWVNVYEVGIEDIVRLAQFLFEKYADCPGILLAFCQIVSKHHIFRPQYYYHITEELPSIYLKNVNSADPDVCVAILALAADNEARGMHTTSLYLSLADTIINGTSIPAITAYFQILIDTNNFQDLKEYLPHVQDRWDELFELSPTRLASLLTEYLKIERITSVKKWIEKMFSSNRFHSYGTLLDLYLPIIQATGTTDLLLQNMESSNTRTIISNLKTMLFALNWSIKESDPIWLDKAVADFFERFPYIIQDNPTDSAKIILSIAKHPKYLGHLAFARVWDVISMYFPKILNSSLDTALRLLCRWFEIANDTVFSSLEVRRSIHDKAVHSLLMCLNHVLSFRDITIIEEVKTLLNTIDRETFSKQRSYFKRILPYMRLYDENLAEILTKRL